MNPAVIDDPQVLAELGAVFQVYEAALMGNDLTALNGSFGPMPGSPAAASPTGNGASRR